MLDGVLIRNELTNRSEDCRVTNARTISFRRMFMLSISFITSSLMFESVLAQTNAPDAPSWNTSTTQPLLRAGVSAMTLGALDVGAPNLFGSPTGLPEDGDHTLKLFDTRTAPYPGPPATGRPNFDPAVHLHHNWDIGSIGNVYGIAIDRDRHIYVTASTHYGKGYFEGAGRIGFGEIGTIGGVPDTAGADTNVESMNDLDAAGAIYKIDAITGDAAVLARLPQQAYSFTAFNCEDTFESTARNTGPALGNIEYDPVHHQLFVSNFEDGKIYRLSMAGVVLSSFDPFIADDNSSGLAPDIKPYGLALNAAGDQLFFGTLDFNNPLDPGLYSIALDSSGDFTGTEVDQDAHLTSDLNYAQDVGGGFTVDPWVSYSDLKFSPTGELMIGVRNGCESQLGTSHNHGGTFYKLVQDGAGLYNTGAPGTVGPDGNFPIHYIADGLGPDDGYGGVSFFDKGDGTYDYLVTSADIEDEPGPHGFMVFPHDYTVGDNVSTYFIAQGASAAGLPSSDSLLATSTDYKGIIGDIETLPTPLDWGDAPDSYGTDNLPVDPTLPLDTITNPGGAAHITTGDGIVIGSVVDPEAGGIPSTGADGDNNAETATGITNDEDAFPAMPMLDAAGSAVFNVPVNNPAAFDVTLYGWFDKNTDGVFDATEFLSILVPAGTSPTVTLDFGALPVTLDNYETYLRLRLTSDVLAADTGFQGYASNGEIEDHLVGVKAVSLGSTIWNDINKNGTQESGEPGILGATITLLDALGAPVAGVTPVVTDAAGQYNFNDLAPGIYRIQVDMSTVANGSTYDLTPTQVADPEGDNNTDSNYDLAADSNVNDLLFISGDIELVAGGEPLNEADPINATGDGLISDPDQPSQSGLENPDNSGNMSLDMGFFIPMDFGDAPDMYATTTGAGGASHVIVDGLQLGLLLDDELNGVPNALANGDDLAISDDEDGIDISAQAVLAVADAMGGTTSSYTLNDISVINTTGSDATLIGYLDFNGDGDFDDVGEQSTTATISASTLTASLTFSGIADTAAGSTYLRLRLSSDGAAVANAGGSAPDGEVEDHVIEILPVVSALKVLVPATNPNTFNLVVGGSSSNGIGNGGATSFVAYDPTIPISLSEFNVDDALVGTPADGGFITQAVCRDQTGLVVLTGATEFVANNTGSTSASISSTGFVLSGNSKEETTITCTWTNVAETIVAVVKNATPADGTDFSFSSTWTGLNNPLAGLTTLDGELVDGADGDGFINQYSGMTPDLGPNTLVITEAIPPAGWAIAGASCSVEEFTAGANLAVSNVVAPTNTFPSNAAVSITVENIEFGDTVSCSFDNIQLVSLGSTLWVESPTAALDGMQQIGEVGIVGANINLLNTDGTAAVDAFGVAATTVTGVNGEYNFNNLLPGDYLVQTEIVAGVSSAVGVADISNLLPTPIQATNPNTNLNLDSNINSLSAFDGTDTDLIWTSDVVSLLPGDEPEDEATPGGVADSDQPAQGVGGANELGDDAGNMTVDMGFYDPYSIGSVVFKDDNNDGIQNIGELGIELVTVQLFESDGATEILVGPDGVLGTADDAAGGVLTNPNGEYNFSGLAQGDYVVNFTTPTGGFAPSGVQQADAETNLNLDSNLIVTSAAAASFNTGAITLGTDGNEPLGTAELDPNSIAEVDSSNTSDAHSNLTIDAGFVPVMNLGNRVWEDTNNNSIYEQGTDLTIQGATVTLLKLDTDPLSGTFGDFIAATDAAGVAVIQQTTGANGQYAFTNLLPGDYKVEVSSPAGFQPVAIQVADPDGATGLVDIDNDSNLDLAASATIETYTSGIVTLSGNDEPVDEEGAGNDGSNGNLTIDFGFYQPLSFGSVVFDDGDNDGVIEATDDNGVQNIGEPGINGATVSLFRVDPTDPANFIPVIVDANGVYVVGQIGTNNSVTSSNLISGVTVADGSYNFSGLPADQYVTQVTPGVGFVPTNTQVSDPENGINLDSNLDLTQTTPAGTWQSGVINLEIGNSPADPAEDDLGGIQEVDPSGINQAKDSNSDLTVDFGFIQQVAIGNTVWLDDGAGSGVINDGIINGTEQGISGVAVELYATGATPGTTTPVATMNTDPNGNYLFDFLDQGTYFVHLPSSNFIAGGVLENATSSLPEGGDVASDDDADENGQNTFVVGGVSSTDIQLAIGGEPLTETGQVGLLISAQADANTNLTVDFALVPSMNLGNQVWEDINNNSAYEPGIDSVIQGATVSLLKQDTDPLSGTFGDFIAATDAAGVAVTQQTTGVSGQYSFTNLLPGDYKVEVSAPTGFQPVAIQVADPDGATGLADTDNDSNLDLAATGTIETYTSGIVTLSGGNEPVDEEAVGNDGSNGNLAVDFGFHQPLSFGSVVFDDGDNDGVIEASDGNGVQDTGEPGINGATVSLFRVDPTNPANFIPVIVDANGVYVVGQVGTNNSVTTSNSINSVTVADGSYNFSGLPADRYVTQVTPGAGFTATLTQVSDPENGINLDSNLDLTQTTPAGTWQSGVINLEIGNSPVDPTEDDLDGNQEVDPSGINQAKDSNSDLTVDFGFIQQVAIGNTVWLDDGAGAGGIQNDGIINGGELGISGVAVQLYATGATPGTTMPIASMNTDSNGNYLFDFLNQGTYFVHLPSSNFGAGAVLEHLVSSLPQGGDVTSDDDADENGQNTLVVDGVSSSDIQLAIGGEPLLETGQVGLLVSAQADANTNLTVDFALVPSMNLGNQVWEDTNVNSVFDAGTDILMVGATVSLIMEDPSSAGDFIVASDIYGAAIGQQMTDGNGQYNFTNLLPGNYKVEVSVAAGFQPVTTQVSDPDGVTGLADTDNDSNLDLAASGIVETYTSGIVTLSGGGEPVDEEAAGDDGTNGNLTVDFGFYQPLSFGSVVFDDGDGDGLVEAGDNNGLQDAGEPGINGAKVSLFRVDPTNPRNLIPVIVDANGVYVADQVGSNNSVLTSNLINSVTVADGSYNFTALPAGQYVVEVMPGVGYVPASNQVADPETGVNLDSNLDVSVSTAYGTWQSGVIDLQVGDSPVDREEDDLDGNQEVDPSGLNQAKDTNSDLTIDFGFVQQVAIGNTVWLDDGTAGGVKDDGILNGGESGIAGVVVDLYTMGDTAGTDTPIATTITDSNGHYLFDFLDQGSYFAHIPASNFAVGAKLEGLSSSSPEGGDVASDDDADENGQNTLDAGGISSTDIELTIGGEPVNEAGQQGAQVSAQADASTNLTVDFGFVPELLGTIGNYLWIDENSDGEQGAAESGLANITVQLKDSGGTVIATELTDSNGGYLFRDLPAGDYFVDVDDATIPTGMTQTDIFTHVTDGDDGDAVDDDGDFGNKEHSGNGYPITLDEGENNLTADFGYNWNPTSDVNTNTGLAALGDRIWIDTDGDGVQDSNETPVSGVVLSLFTDPDSDGVFDTPYAPNPAQTTDANGNYLFDDLPADAYVVVVTDSATASHDVLAAGSYSQTGDPDHYAANQSAADAGEAGDYQSTSPIVLSPGDVFLNVDFGYQPSGVTLGSVGDTIWVDLDSDGSGPNIPSIDGQLNPTVGQGNNLADDSAEPTIPGVTVALVLDINGNGRADASEPIIATDVSDQNGQYLFDGLADGDYVVKVTDTANVLNGFSQTYDSDGPLGSPNESAVNVTAGSVDRIQDFGYVSDNPSNPNDGLIGSIGDTIWGDLDASTGNQTTQGNEPGLPNVTINLYVDENGDGAPDDVNNDGTVDATDAVQTTSTDGNGSYLFSNLPLSTYIVGVDDSTLPTGYDPLSTYLPLGGGGEDDASTANDLGDPLTLSAAAPHNRDQDFSYPRDPAQLGSGVIGDTIWGDLDADGHGPTGVTSGPNAVGVAGPDDALEPVFAGVSVRLFDVNNKLVGTDVTDSGGNYLFTGLDPDGGYTVVVDTSTLPAGFEISPSGEPEGDDNSTSFVDLGDAGAGTEDGVNDPDGENAQNLGQDFGYPPAVVLPANIVGSIGDTVWFDQDDSGDPQANQGSEPGLAGVTVSLKPPATVDLGSGLGVAISTVTDENGEYLFSDLPLDDGGAPTLYTVTIDPSSLPSYVSSTPSFDPDATLDNTSIVAISNTTPDDRDQDFSYPPQLAPASIGDTIFIDNGGTPGVQDLPDSADPDTPVSGVLVNLLEDTNGDGTPDTPVASLVTDENGQYLFTGLDPNGVYSIVVDPSNTAVGGVLEGMTNNVDPDGVNDETSVVDFNDPQDGNADPDGLENNTNLGQDFGYTATIPTKVGNLIWLDLNADGNYDPLGADGVVSSDDETPIGGVTIDIYRDLNGNGEVDPGEPLFGSTRSSDTIDAANFEADGNYLFTDLPADTYVVQVSDEDAVLAGHNHSEGMVNTDNNSQAETYAASTVGGVDDLTADFGYYTAPGAIGNVVWEDIDGDGLYDPLTEPGIDGVKVQLNITYPNGDTTALTTVTAFGGKYEFDNLLLDEDFNGQIAVSFGGGGDEPLHTVSLDQVTLPGHLDPIFDNFPANTDSVPGIGDPAGGIATDEDDSDVGGDDGNLGEPAYPPQGSVDTTNDFGFSPLASLGNRVWLDLDRDGVQDANEDGIANVTVSLLADTDGNGLIDGAELTTPIETTSTGPDGEYLFRDLLPGTVYATVVDFSTVIPGLTQTFDEGEGLGATDNMSDPITLIPNEEHLTADFGYAPAAGFGTIGDRIWVDADGDGVQDPGELGLPNVTVSLQPAPDVDLGNGNGVAIEVDTDANGNYLFTNLPLDETYIVSVVDIASDAPLYTADPDGSGDPDVRDSNSSNHDDQTTVILTTENPVNLDADFGYLPNDSSVNNSISGTIWKDLDADGNGPSGAGDNSDTTELGLPGVIVTLLDSTGVPIATTITDSSGTYQFSGLPDGDYTVQVTDQNNVLGGLQPTADSDDPANPGAFLATTPNRSEVLGLSGGVSNDLQDFGYLDPSNNSGVGAIGDTIFFDSDNSGDSSNSDPNVSEGIEGVTVQLFGPGPDGDITTDADNVLVDTTTTDENGNYLFTGLEVDDTGANPGTDYKVVVVTATLPGSGNGWINSVDPEQIVTGMDDSQSVVTLSTGGVTQDLDQDFGYTSDANNVITGTVWSDTDGDGEQVEAGTFSGVTIELQDENGNVLQTTQTGVDGNYTFANLPDGIYQVVVTDQDNVLGSYEHTNSPNGNSDVGDETSKDDTGYRVDLDSGGVSDTPVTDSTGDFGYQPIITNPISLGLFKTQTDGDSVIVSWSTQTEVANIGFNIYGQIDGQWQQLNDTLIISLGDSVSIQSYELNVTTPAKMFSIGDIDLRGKETLHGPYALGQSYGDMGARISIDWQGEELEREAKKARRLELRKIEQRKRNKTRRLKYKSQKKNDLSSRPGTYSGEGVEVMVMQREVSVFNNFLNSALVAVLAVLAPDAQAAQADGSAGEDIVNIKTVESGIHELSYDYLNSNDVDLLGVPVADIALISQGKSVPVQVIGSDADPFVFGVGSRIRFIAKQVDTLYTDTNVYTLRLDQDDVTRITSQNIVTPVGEAANAYLATRSYAPQLKYSFVSPDESDPWYAKRIVAVGSANQEVITLALDNVAVGGNNGATQAKLKVSLWGSTDLEGAGNDHHVQVYMNGTNVLDDRFDGLNATQLETNIEQINNGDNNVLVRLPMDTGFAFDAVAVNEIQVNYPRHFVATENQIDFSSALAKFRIQGMTKEAMPNNSADLLVMVEDHAGTRILTGGDAICRSSGCNVEFGGTGRLGHYYVASKNTLINEPVIDPLPLDNDIQSGNAAYLIISHPDFIETSEGLLESLAADVATQYGSADVIDVEAIYAQYGNHLFGPQAIKAYIKDAVENRDTEIVLLVGGDVYDYRQFENENAESFMPSIYAATGNSVTFAPVDAKYVDLDNDNVPDLPIGRLPVRTVAQLASLLSKRDDYLSRGYSGSALLIADEYDDIQQYDFGSDADEITNDYLDGSNWDISTAYVDDIGVGNARREIISKINEGQSLTAFFGHSSTNQWGFSGLFNGPDAANLKNQGKPTVVTQWGCWNAYYVSPNEDSMGHRFMMEGDQGAVAVMGASTLTNANSERVLARMVFARLSNGERLGEAVTNAKQEYAQTKPDDLDVLLGWTILGLPELFVN